MSNKVVNYFFLLTHKCLCEGETTSLLCLKCLFCVTTNLEISSAYFPVKNPFIPYKKPRGKGKY